MLKRGFWLVSIFKNIVRRRSKRLSAEAAYSEPTAEQHAEFAHLDHLYGLADDAGLDGLGLMKALMLYRPRPITKYLSSIGKQYSMMHPDVLVLLYYLARHVRGDILEIGPYIGGSTIAAAKGARDAPPSKTVVTIEHGVAMANTRISSGDTIEDLKRNLTRHGVADLCRVIVGEANISSTFESVRQFLSPESVGLFIMDADGAVCDALSTYEELLIDNCWLVIDDYFAVGGGANKALRSKTEIDLLVTSGALSSAGFFGWGTWIGRWRRNPQRRIEGSST